MYNHPYSSPEQDQETMSHEARQIDAKTCTLREPLFGNQEIIQEDGNFENQDQERVDLEESKVMEVNDRNDESKPNGFENLQEQLDKVLAGWKIVKKMGEEASGAVYRIQRFDGSLRIIKLFEKKSEEDYERETSILELLKDYSSGEILEHPSDNEKFILDDYFMIVTKAGFATLKQFKRFLWEKKISLDETQLMSILCALYGSLKYLRDKNIFHRDIKSDNIILHYKKLENTMHLQLTDYSIAQIYGDFTKLSGFGGTPEYVDPKSSNHPSQKYTKDELISADLFSIGVVILELACTDFTPGQDGTETIMNKLLQLHHMQSLSEILSIILFDQERGLEELDKLVINSGTKYEYFYNPSSPLELKEYIEDFKDYIQDPKEHLKEKYSSYDQEEFVAVDCWLKQAKYYEEIGEVNQALYSYELIINHYLMQGDDREVSIFCQKILNHLQHIEEPITFSILGVYLCSERRFDDALEMFTLGLEKAIKTQNEKLQLIIYNNIGCLFFYSNAEDPRMMENFNKAYEILKCSISGFRYNIIERWLSISCSNSTKINRAPIIDYSQKDRLYHCFTVILTIKDMDFGHNCKVDPDNRLDSELVSIIFFNIGYVNALFYERRLEREQQNNKLESIHQLCFYFNHPHTRSVYQIFGLPGRLDFLYFFLKFLLIVQEKNPSLDSDPIFLEASNLYEYRKSLFETFSTLGYFFPEIITTELFPVFIGFPLLISGPILNKEWRRKELLLDKISVLRHASRLIRIENRDSKEDNQTPEQQRKQRARFQNYLKETQNPNDPILDLVPFQACKRFPFNKSKGFVKPITYEMVWNNLKLVDQQDWSLYYVQIISTRPFVLDDDEDLDILEDWLFKLRTVKKIDWLFSQEGSIAEKLDLSIFSAFRTIQLTHLHLSFNCKNGLLSYPIETVTKYIESQATLISLKLTNHQITLEDKDFSVLGLTLNKMITLREFELKFNLCPNVTCSMIKTLIDTVDYTLSLESLSIFFPFCEGMVEQNKYELKDLIQSKFPSLKTIRVGDQLEIAIAEIKESKERKDDEQV